MNPSPPAHAHTWGLRPNALWHESLEGFEGRVASHESWMSCREALIEGGRRVHDFYFRIGGSAAACEDCQGSGVSADYLEFEQGFLPSGGGRWAGWGLQPLWADEAELLVDGRLPSHVVEAAISSPELLSPEAAILVGEVVAPLRAKMLGIPVQCRTCRGEETTCDELLVWSFGTTPGSGRIDVVRDVAETEHADIKEFMREAFKDVDVRLRPLPGRAGWDLDERGFDGAERAWFMRNERTPTFETFLKGIGAADDRNLLFDVHVVPTEPGRCMLRFWMTHPARGYGREILVEDASEDDAPALARVLEDHYQVHKRNFHWAFDTPDEGFVDFDDAFSAAFPDLQDGRRAVEELMTWSTTR